MANLTVNTYAIATGPSHTGETKMKYIITSDSETDVREWEAFGNNPLEAAAGFAADLGRLDEWWTREDGSIHSFRCMSTDGKWRGDWRIREEL